VRGSNVFANRRFALAQGLPPGKALDQLSAFDSEAIWQGRFDRRFMRGMFSTLSQSLSQPCRPPSGSTPRQLISAIDDHGLSRNIVVLQEEEKRTRDVLGGAAAPERKGSRDVGPAFIGEEGRL
jgi:hypothetical protein